MDMDLDYDIDSEVTESVDDTPVLDEMLGITEETEILSESVNEVEDAVSFEELPDVDDYIETNHLETSEDMNEELEWMVQDFKYEQNDSDVPDDPVLELVKKKRR